MEEIKATKNAKYSVVAREIDGPAGRWKLSVVQISLVEGSGQKMIGEYTRNYPRFGIETFLPFSRGDRDYALYSRDYTCTRIMELPSCRDIGGEEPSPSGFCPVDYFVPEISTSENRKRESEIGLVAGCKWGDDSSWKVQYLDLSDVHRGTINRNERLGYLELPTGVSLEKAVVVANEATADGVPAVRLRIACVSTFDLLTGKPMAYDPYE